MQNAADLLHAGTHKHEYIPPVLVSLLIDFKILLLFLNLLMICCFCFPGHHICFRATGRMLEPIPVAYVKDSQLNVSPAFDGSSLRPPAPGSLGLEPSTFRFSTQTRFLYCSPFCAACESVQAVLKDFVKFELSQLHGLFKVCAK